MATQWARRVVFDPKRKASLAKEMIAACLYDRLRQAIRFGNPKTLVANDADDLVFREGGDAGMLNHGLENLSAMVFCRLNWVPDISSMLTVVCDLVVLELNEQLAAEPAGTLMVLDNLVPERDFQMVQEPQEKGLSLSR